MPKFVYEAIDAKGEVSSDTISGDSSAAVGAALARRGLTATSIKAAEDDGLEEVEGSGIAASEGPMTVAERIKAMDADVPEDLSKVKVKAEELMIFTRQLATMVDAGLPIDNALETLAEQTKGDAFKIVLYSMLGEIRSGSRISDAVKKFPRIFPDIYVSMVRAAEASGQLGMILNQLAGYMEAAAKIKQKVKAAMTYPVIATCMITVVAGILILVVVPQFAKMFDMVKGDLPLPTVIVLALSNFMRGHFFLFMLIVGSTFTAFIMTIRTEKGAYAFDAFKLGVPVFGPLFRQVAVAKFARTLSTLLSSGVPILDALEIVERAAGNAVIAKVVSESIMSVSAGAGLAEVFEKKPVFPPMLIKMISVGEQTGQLDNLLGKLADFYDDRVNAAVEGLTSMIEPLLIGVLGVVVGGIVVAIFFPMIKITQSMGNG